MAKSSRDRELSPKSVDPDTGELYDPTEPRRPKRRKFLQALKSAASDAVVRHTSTKR
jgi:hypothetical protein